MPIYLPPISRREFLKRSAAAVAVAASGCVSQRRPSRQQSWALLSDIHIAADPARVEKGVNMTENLRTVVQEVLAWPERPRNILINGDLAFNTGETGDYAGVIGLLRPLREGGMPLHLGLGNHDSRERFWEAVPDAKSLQKSLADRQVAVIRTPEANWFLLDSLIHTRETPGLLGEAQRGWLAAALDVHADKPAMVAVHHNPRRGLKPDKNGLEDTEELLAILRPHRHVKAYFFGHTHRWSVSRDESGLHLVNLPPTAYVFESGRPNGWVHATVRDDGIRLELRCLDKTRVDHGQIADLKWRA